MGIFIQDKAINNVINLNFYILSQILFILIVIILFKKRSKEIELESLIKEEIEKNRKQAIMLSQQSRLAQMGEAINMIAHQWRQPLNILNGLVILMNMKLSRQNSNNEYLLEKEFKKIETTTAYMSRTIDDFRNFFKPQKEKIEFDLKETIESATRLLQPIMLYDDIKINHTYRDKIRLTGYPNEIGQVIINIINNAKDALISNNINRDKHIHISLYKESEKIVITIQDNAGGIDNEIIDNIFDPYFSTKLKKNGTGLGLYISKMIIEEHMNGKLSVKNSNIGAIFRIEFSSP